MPKRLMSKSLSAIVLLSAAAAHAGELLPAEVTPIRYELQLAPDAGKLVFAADLRIEVRVLRAVRTVVLNAEGLAFDEVRLEDGRRATVSLEPASGRARLRFASPLTAGLHTLAIRYHGPILRGTLGFFAMDYASASGPHRTLVTNFEPTAERRLLPSWDEPGRKAVFQLSVDIPAADMAVSNMPVQAETPLTARLKRVRFAATPKMSSYLLFLAVGDLERVSETAEGVSVGVIVAKGEAARARYTLRAAVSLLHYYNEYFAVRYPLPKLDLVAAPGQIEGDSMENWGAILFSQEHVLFDDALSTEADRQELFAVVAHEMAHQWFGNLVTMQWWDNLWLNEGFARWMETKAAEGLHPEWRSRLQSLASFESGMRSDSKSTAHAVERTGISAAEAELAFDAITYEKGAAVIGMVEDTMGPERFRDGVRRYMHRHAFGNTSSADLWRELQGAAGMPILDIARDFTRRRGLPLISVEPVEPDARASGAATAVLRQSRFWERHRLAQRNPPEKPWTIPLKIRSIDSATVTPVLLATTQRPAASPGAGPLLVNAGRRGYLRVQYAPAAFVALTAHIGTLAPADQLAMLYDAYALGRSEYAPLSRVMDLVTALPVDADPAVWMGVVDILTALDRYYAATSERAAFRRWAVARLRPVAAPLSWHPAPGETPGATLLRGPLLTALSRFDDRAVIAAARLLYAASIAEQAAQPADTRRFAREVAARHADNAALDAMLVRLRADPDPLERRQLLEDFARAADAVVAGRMLQLAMGPETPAGSMPSLILDVARNHPDLAWRFVQTHVADPAFNMDLQNQDETIPVVPQTSVEVQRVEELRRFAAAHLSSAASRLVEETAAQIQLNARVQANGLSQIDAWLRAHAASVNGAAQR